MFYIGTHNYINYCKNLIKKHNTNHNTNNMYCVIFNNLSLRVINIVDILIDHLSNIPLLGVSSCNRNIIVTSILYLL